jgi:Na+/H+-dicarboxylate symporter
MTATKSFILIASFLVPFICFTLAGVLVKVNHIRSDDSQQLEKILLTYATSWGLSAGVIGLTIALVVIFARKSYLSRK